MVFAAALAVYIAERESGGSIASFSDAVWWAVTTITTVGYGDTYPTTPTGRGIAVLLMLAGISLFGLLTARIAAFFVEEEATVAPHLSVVMRQPLAAAGRCFLADARAASVPPRREAELGTGATR